MTTRHVLEHAQLRPRHAPATHYDTRRHEVLAAALLALAAGCAPSAGPVGASGSREEREAACATIKACSYRGSDFGPCVGSPGEELSPSLACFARANGNCDAAFACLGLQITLGGGCAASSDACDGAAAVGCEPDGYYVEHRQRRECPAPTTCIETITDGARCGVACTADTCLGTDRVRCLGGYGEVEPCPSGTACAISAALGVPVCAAMGPPCSASRCDGDRLVSCGPDGREYPPVDCGSWGLRCTSGTSGLDCTAPSPDCDHRTEPARCESGSIVYCGDDDVTHRFDCGAHGFLGCTGGGIEGPYCVPTGTVIYAP